MRNLLSRCPSTKTTTQIAARAFAGHSKWQNIKYKKAITDKAKSKEYARLTTKIRAAMATADGDADALGVQTAVVAARAGNVPKANIERALSKGNDTAVFERIVYEASLGEVAVVVEGLTENKNRTAGRIRHLMDKSGGSLSSVMWAFDQRGVVEFLTTVDVAADAAAVEAASEWLVDAAIDAGALDVEVAENFSSVEVVCEYGDLGSVRDTLRAAVAAEDVAQFELRRAELAFIPNMFVPIEEQSAAAGAVDAMLEHFDDEDWVMKVSHNAELVDALE